MRRLILAIFSLLTFSTQALAATYYINLNNFIPTGGLAGPCYCGRGLLYSFSGFRTATSCTLGRSKPPLFSTTIPTGASSRRRMANMR